MVALPNTEVGIYKRKEESKENKKTRFRGPRKKERKHTIDQEKRKTFFLFFLFYFVSYKFSPLAMAD